VTKIFLVLPFITKVWERLGYSLCICKFGSETAAWDIDCIQ